MKITDIEINDRVTFKHGDNLEFVATGVVFYKEEYSDGFEDKCILHVEVKELPYEFFEVIESEILKAYS